VTCLGAVYVWVQNRYWNRRESYHSSYFLNMNMGSVWYL
jgi:hypothetical protein